MENEPVIVKETTPTPGAEGGETTVNITQDKLNSLINEKFKAGATKASSELLESLGVESVDSLKEILKAKADADEASKSELEKANEKALALATEKEQLESKYQALEKANTLSKLAAQHGIKDVDYFKYEYERASSIDGFDEAVFVDNLLKTKGGLLTGDTSISVPNPKNVNNDQNLSTISMADYSMLPPSERAKIKPSQITKD